MKIEDSVLPFLAGDEFSSGLRVRLSGAKRQCRTRIEELLLLCDAKRVLHVGFADHTSLIEEKARRGMWLHGLLLKRAARCVGVDINPEAIAYCRDTLRIRDVFQHDVLKDEPLDVIASEYFDVALLGEVLEHLKDPVGFLDALRTKYGQRLDKVVITVPNAFDLSNFVHARHSIEFINTDHRFWFTPYTLAKVASDAGFVPVEFFYPHENYAERWLYGALRRRYPMLRETIIGVFARRDLTA